MKLFGRKKKKADDDEDVEPEVEEAEPEPEPEPDGEEDGEKKKKRSPFAFLQGKGKIIAIGMAGFLLVGGVIGGAGWWFLGRSKSAAPPPQADVTSGTAVNIAMPQTPGASGGLTPPGGPLTAQPGPDAPPPPGAAPTAAKAPTKAKAAGKDKAGTMATQDALGGGTLNAAASSGAGAGVMIPAMGQAAFASIPDRGPSQPLSGAPDPALLDKQGDVGLPKIGKDGKKPMLAYAKPSEAKGDNPRVAIIVAGLGLSRAGTFETLKKLPSAVTLAFDPYAKNLNDWTVRARQAGFESLVMLPMEPIGFPVRDGGPLALQASLKPPENVTRLETVLAKMAGYVGVLSASSTQFTALEEPLKPILEAIKSRGLMYVDGPGQAKSLAPKIAADIGLPKAMVDMAIDDEPARAAIDAKLLELETLARRNATVVAIAHAYPSTVDRLVAWAQTLPAKKIDLVPVSALADKQIR